MVGNGILSWRWLCVQLVSNSWTVEPERREPHRNRGRHDGLLRNSLSSRAFGMFCHGLHDDHGGQYRRCGRQWNDYSMQQFAFVQFVPLAIWIPFIRRNLDSTGRKFA